MAALTCDLTEAVEPASHRNMLLRLLDVLAEQSMRHSHHVINRGHDDRAVITSVSQPSSAIERSSINP